MPGDAIFQWACDLLDTFFPKAREIRCEITEEVRFIDQGQNWERVLCSVCGAELDPAWWSEAMDAAHQTGFAHLLVKLPCCGSLFSLNDLQYELPAGFARAVLKVYSPGGDIDKRQLRALEKILECKLRKIWARYRALVNCCCHLAQAKLSAGSAFLSGGKPGRQAGFLECLQECGTVPNGGLP